MAPTTAPNAKSGPPKYRFRLLRGKHSQSVPDPNGRKDANGNIMLTAERNLDGTIKLYQPGDVIETNKDLVELFNRPGAIKFERLEKADGPIPGSSTPTAKQPPKFYQMTDKELREYAAAEEIDISQCKNKDEVLKLLVEVATAPA